MILNSCILKLQRNFLCLIVEEPHPPLLELHFMNVEAVEGPEFWVLEVHGLRFGFVCCPTPKPWIHPNENPVPKSSSDTLRTRSFRNSNCSFGYRPRPLQHPPRPPQHPLQDRPRPLQHPPRPPQDPLQDPPTHPQDPPKGPR